MKPKRLTKKLAVERCRDHWLKLAKLPYAKMADKKSLSVVDGKTPAHGCWCCQYVLEARGLTKVSGMLYGQCSTLPKCPLLKFWGKCEGLTPCENSPTSVYRKWTFVVGGEAKAEYAQAIVNECQRLLDTMR